MLSIPTKLSNSIHIHIFILIIIFNNYEVYACEHCTMLMVKGIRWYTRKSQYMLE
jgi:hypothetical protein